MTIQCPWHKGHTTGGDTAGYSPLGRGGSEYQNRRGFYCMHGHCAEHDTGEYLHWMANLGAPELPIYDEAAHLVRDYAFDAN